MHSGKVILIVGGTGQVGTAAAAALLRRGWKEIDL
jgi:NAD(P)-dependent dehydrogenase (short-subunit alcohol dehydrogenase family)